MKIDIFVLLTIIFTVLKLTDSIDWSWWWVLSPILIPIGIIIVAAAYISISD